MDEKIFSRVTYGYEDYYGAQEREVTSDRTYRTIPSPFPQAPTYEDELTGIITGNIQGFEDFMRRFESIASWARID